MTYTPAVSSEVVNRCRELRARGVDARPVEVEVRPATTADGKLKGWKVTVGLQHDVLQLQALERRALERLRSLAPPATDVQFQLYQTTVPSKGLTAAAGAVCDVPSITLTAARIAHRVALDGAKV
jgi:hypothetical protein